MSNAHTFHCKQGISNVPRGGKPRRILLPIDIAKCPLEVFPFVNELAGEHETPVTLLHVMGGSGAKNESLMNNSRAAEKYLDLLAGKFINPRFSSQTSIRVGTPAGEILVEAKLLRVDLIVLTSYGDSSLWKRPIRSKIVQAVMDAAPCDITLLPVRTWFNCEQQWELVDEIVQALDYVGLLRPTLKHL